MLLVIRKHSICTAMAETGLSAAMTGTGKVGMRQTADTSSIQGPLNLMRGTVLLKPSATGRDQTHPAIPNREDSLMVIGIVAVTPIIYIVLVRLEDVTGLTVPLSILLLFSMLHRAKCKYIVPGNHETYFAD